MHDTYFAYSVDGQWSLHWSVVPSENIDIIKTGITKGQLISKAIYGRQDRKTNSFVRFLGEFTAQL